MWWVVAGGPCCWLTRRGLGLPLPSPGAVTLPGSEAQSPPSGSPHRPPRPAVYVITGIFCLASSTGLYSCLSPLLQRLPFCRCR